jgi:hypothetical protein
MSTAVLPDDIRAALLRHAKQWVMNNYIGGRKQLVPWTDHYASLTSVHTYDFPGGSALNLRRLTKLVAEGVLIERMRWQNGRGVRTFAAQKDVLDAIGQQAVSEWQAAGYVLGEMTPSKETQ